MQHLRRSPNSAAARTQAAKPRAAAVATVAAAPKPYRLSRFHRLPSILNRLASCVSGRACLRGVSLLLIDERATTAAVYAARNSTPHGYYYAGRESEVTPLLTTRCHPYTRQPSARSCLPTRSELDARWSTTRLHSATRGFRRHPR